MRLIYRVMFYFRLLIYFIAPNVIKFLNNRIIVKGNLPRCNQLTKITGKGTFMVEKNCSFGYKLGGYHKSGMIEFQARNVDAKIIIGENVATNNNILICAANYINIGNNTLIGHYVTIMDFEAHGIEPNKRRELGEVGNVIIGKNVWIGNNVTILKNSEIGENTIIATGAVVAGVFPANVIIGGIPAKIIKNL